MATFWTVVGVGKQVVSKVPAWAWLVMFVALALFAKEWRDARRIADLQRKLDAAQTQAIEQAKDAVKGDLKSLQDRSKSLQQSVQQVQQQVQRAEAANSLLSQDLDRQRKERDRLVTSGTLDEVVQAGRTLGYHPVPARRPQ